MTTKTLAPGFIVAEGRCWRIVYDFAARGSHCREPVGWSGLYVNPKGKRWTVWSCQDHLVGLDEVRPSVTGMRCLRALSQSRFVAARRGAR
jgi:hypothetical protein